MSPDEFVAAYGSTADAVSAGTGIDRTVLLAQWACETAYGSAIYNQNNLGNIRCLAGIPCAGGFSQFPTLNSFVTACIGTWRNGYYGAVLAAATPWDQLAAIVASPWDAGHYGGSLDAYYTALGGMSMQQYSVLKADLDQILTLLEDQASGLNALAAAIAAFKAASGGSGSATDLTPVLNAVTALKVAVDAQAADVATVKRLVQKDLAP